MTFFRVQRSDLQNYFLGEEMIGTPMVVVTGKDVARFCSTQQKLSEEVREWMADNVPTAQWATRRIMGLDANMETGVVFTFRNETEQVHFKLRFYEGS